MRSLVLFIAASTLAFAAGCTVTSTQSGPSQSSSSSSTAAADTSTFCSTVCGRSNECDHATDRDTCISACNNTQAGTLPKLRADLVNDLEACVTRADCATVLGSSLMSSCVDEASVSIAPTDATRHVCEVYEAAAGKCGSAAIDHAKCLSYFKIYADATVDQAVACTQKSCSQIDACVDAVLGN